MRAQVPLGLETQQLLSSNLQLQEALHQARVDLDDRAAEASRARQALDAHERTTTCQVCMQRRVDAALQPCGHLLCTACAAQIRDRCPFCRHDLSGSTVRLRW